MSTHQDLIPGHLREFHKIVEEEPSRGCCKIFTQERPKNSLEELACKL